MRHTRIHSHTHTRTRTRALTPWHEYTSPSPVINAAISTCSSDRRYRNFFRNVTRLSVRPSVAPNTQSLVGRICTIHFLALLVAICEYGHTRERASRAHYLRRRCINIYIIMDTTLQSPIILQEVAGDALTVLLWGASHSRGIPWRRWYIRETCRGYDDALGLEDDGAVATAATPRDRDTHRVPGREAVRIRRQGGRQSFLRLVTYLRQHERNKPAHKYRHLTVTWTSFGHQRS